MTVKYVHSTVHPFYIFVFLLRGGKAIDQRACRTTRATDLKF